ncbi:hypothetical protein OY671_009018, partial [Metschnikowia pulcherrima]
GDRRVPHVGARRGPRRRVRGGRGRRAVGVDQRDRVPGAGVVEQRERVGARARGRGGRVGARGIRGDRPRGGGERDEQHGESEETSHADLPGAVTGTTSCPSDTRVAGRGPSRPRAVRASMTAMNGSGVTTTGQGAVTATPDVAVVELGAEASAPGVQDALDRANAGLAAARDALVAHGVAPSDSRTSQTSTWTEQREDGPRTTARLTSRATSRDVGASGEVVR